MVLAWISFFATSSANAAVTSSPRRMQVLKSSSLMKPGPASGQGVTNVPAADSCAAVVLMLAHNRAVAAPIASVSRATTFNPFGECRPRLVGYPKLARVVRTYAGMVNGW